MAATTEGCNAAGEKKGHLGIPEAVFMVSTCVHADTKGDLQIQYGGANNLALLLPGCGRFKEVRVVEFIDGRLQCLNNWKNKDPAAYDYSEAVRQICIMEGETGNEAEKEESARNSIVDVIKGEITDTHPVAPQLAVQADALTTSFSNEILSSDLDAYRAALKSMATLIKPDGCLFMNVLLGCSFAVIGEHRLPILPLTEEDVKQAVTDEGFKVNKSYVTPRLNDALHEGIDFTHIMFVIACKEGCSG